MLGMARGGGVGVVDVFLKAMLILSICISGVRMTERWVETISTREKLLEEEYDALYCAEILALEANIRDGTTLFIEHHPDQRERIRFTSDQALATLAEIDLASTQCQFNDWESRAWRQNNDQTRGPHWVAQVFYRPQNP